MAKHCKSDRLRCLRCSEGHTTDSCKTKTAHCPQCGGEHAAWDRHCPVLAAYFANQEDPMKKTTNPNTESKTDTGTQTKSPTLKDTTTSPRPTNTKDAATEPVKLPRTRTISVKTDDLPPLRACYRSSKNLLEPVNIKRQRRRSRLRAETPTGGGAAPAKTPEVRCIHRRRPSQLTTRGAKKTGSHQQKTSSQTTERWGTLPGAYG